MFGKRLKELRENNQFSMDKLIEIYNQKYNAKMNKSTLSRYENGLQEPIYTVVVNFADFFNVSVDYISGGSNYRDNSDSSIGKGVKIPVLGKVVAGIPIEAVEEILDYEEITQEMASQGDYFGLQVKGNSMEPKFSEGDVVIVRKQSDVDTGDIAIVLVNGNEATIKKIRKREDGIELVPSNHDYDIAFYSNKQIEELPIVIIGKVVELRAKF